MIEVKFYEAVEDSLLKFAVIAAKYQGQWIFCRHKLRNTFEIPGGHREPGEDIQAAAKRELFEETGATDYSLIPVGVYAVEDDSTSPIPHKTFGQLFFAEVYALGPLPEFEIGEVKLFDDLPAELTYPQIQLCLFAKIKAAGL